MAIYRIAISTSNLVSSGSISYKLTPQIICKTAKFFLNGTLHVVAMEYLLQMGQSASAMEVSIGIQLN